MRRDLDNRVNRVGLAIVSGRNPSVRTCVVIEVSWEPVRRFGDEQ